MPTTSGTLSTTQTVGFTKPTLFTERQQAGCRQGTRTCRTSLGLPQVGGDKLSATSSRLHPEHCSLSSTTLRWNCASWPCFRGTLNSSVCTPKGVTSTTKL